MDLLDDCSPPMPALEHACYFASWCSVGEFSALSRPWLDYVFILADVPPGGNAPESNVRARA
jgi:hypothetical protein